MLFILECVSFLFWRYLHGPQFGSGAIVYNASIGMTILKQYSGVDYRKVVIDDRISTPLNNFTSIVD